MNKFDHVKNLTATYKHKAIFLTILSLVLVSLSGVGHADNKSQPHQSLHISSIVPNFTLSYSNGEKWSLTEHVGTKPLILIVIGATPHIQSNKYDRDDILSSIANSEKLLRSRGYQVITIFPRNRYRVNSELSKALPRYMRALDPLFADLDVYEILSAHPDDITLIGIDKFGYLRRVEKLPVSGVIGTSIINSANFKISISKNNIAPDFSTQLKDRTNFRLANYRGWKKVLLLFMPEVMDCDCENPINLLRKKQMEINSSNIEVLIVSPNKKISASIKNQNGNFDIAYDYKKNIRKLYYNNIPLYQTVAVIIDKDGRLKHLISGRINDEFIDSLVNLGNKKNADKSE